MQINKAKFEKVVKEAKAKTNDSRWLAAIERAAEGVLSGAWIVTELADGIAVTTESGKTYFANGHCQCEAFRRGAPCKHRAAARLLELYAAAGAAAARITRSVESNHTGQRHAVVRCDGWAV
jgi:hypothetical protein